MLKRMVELQVPGACLVFAMDRTCREAVLRAAQTMNTVLAASKKAEPLLHGKITKAFGTQLI
jgi:hypothetical protein